MKIKRLWNNNNIDVVEIEGRWFALYGWNGYEYTDCWETDENTSPLVDNKIYSIKPIYKELEDDEFEVIGYELT